VEQHLGDHLAALVDGELEHETRERVLAHLATCWGCKAEAEAQRQLKSVFAEAAPPSPSEGLLARLQELSDADDGPGGPFGQGTGGVFGVRTGGFAYVPADRYGGRRASRDSGFRIHDMERSASRGRRLAFAAAGAVSLAAFALGGALPLEAAVDAQSGRGEGTGATARPARTPQAGDAVSVSGGDALLAASDTHPFLLRAPEGVGPSFLAPTTHASAQLPASMVLSPLIRPPMAPGPQDAAPFGGILAGLTSAPAASHHASPPSPQPNRAAPLAGSATASERSHAPAH
jgi:hypothetical protein